MATNTFITNKAVRQTEYINTQTLRVPRDTIERRDMGAMFMTMDKRVPFDELLTFKNADEVCKHFGVNSEQYKIAKKYFDYTESNTDKQTQLSFGRWAKGDKTNTYTLMPIRFHLESENNYDYKRDAKALLIDPMKWFVAENGERTVQGFCSWFDANYNAGVDDVASKKRGIICLETRNDDTPQVYYAPSEDKTSWERVASVEANDVITFRLYIEDCIKYYADGSEIKEYDTTKRYGDGEIFKAYVQYQTDDEEPQTVEVATYFQFNKYEGNYTKKSDVEPNFTVVANVTEEELSQLESDFRESSVVDGLAYRVYSDTATGYEYHYYIWDKRLKQFVDGGINGAVSSSNLAFSFATVDEMESQMSDDVNTLNTESTVLRTVDRASLLTYYKKFDKETKSFVDACKRLSGGVGDLTSSILFGDIQRGTVDDLDSAELNDGDLVPLVSNDNFKTKFYKYEGGAFVLQNIKGKDEFDIFDNYPEYEYECQDSIENIGEVDAEDGDFCLVRNVSDKSLSSSFFVYSDADEKWKPVEGMQNKDIPDYYPYGYYTCKSVTKVGDDDYECELEIDDTTMFSDGDIATFIDYTQEDFVKYYFVWNDGNKKWLYVRKTSAYEQYPDESVSATSLAELYNTRMSSYDEDVTPYVVGKVVDKTSWYTTYYVYSVHDKAWSARGVARDNISDYPISGSITSVSDPYDIAELNKIISDNALIAVVNPSYNTYFGEGYYSWNFSTATWTQIYSNSARSADADSSHDIMSKDYLEANEEAAQRSGYPVLDGVYHDTTNDKYYMWYERYYFTKGMCIGGFEPLITREDKNGDGKYYTSAEEYVSVDDLFNVAKPYEHVTTIYKNSTNGGDYVYSLAVQSSDGDGSELQYTYFWCKIVSTRAASSFVKIQRLIGSCISDSLTVDDFRTDYTGVLLKITTSQERLKPTSASKYETKPLTYTIPISCRDEIDSYEALAALIQSKIRLMRGLESVSVYCVKSYGKYHFEIEFEDTIGITSIISEDTDSTYVKNLGLYGATVSDVSSHAKESAVDAIQRVTSMNNNYGSFAFMDEPVYDTTVNGGANVTSYETPIDADDIEKLFAWNKAENFMFMCVVGISENTTNNSDTDSDESNTLRPLDIYSLPQNEIGLGNVVVVKGGERRDYEEVVPMAVFAATMYDEEDSINSFMFKHFDTGTFTPTVGYTPTSFSELTKAEQWSAQNAERAKKALFDERNVNYIARTQEFGLQRRDYFQQGKCYDGMDISTYCSEVWLKDAFSTALLKLLMQNEKMSPTITTLNLASAVMTPVVTEAEENGMIVVPESPLDDKTRIYIDQQTGVEGAYEEIEKDGYLLQFDFADDTKNGGKAIFYRFMYCKNGDIRKIEGLHAYRE